MPRRKKTEQQQVQQFALMLPVVLGLLATLAWWRENPRAGLGLLIAGPVICLVALVLPPVWLRLFRLWMKLGAALNFVMTRVILTVFYYLILTPFSLVMRLFGKAPLDLAWKDGKASYWVDKPAEEGDVERYEKQY